MTEGQYQAFVSAVIPLGPTLMIGLLVAERLFPREGRRPSSVWRFTTSAPVVSWIFALLTSAVGIVGLLLGSGPDSWMHWVVGVSALTSVVAFTTAMTETFVKRHFIGDHENDPTPGADASA